MHSLIQHSAQIYKSAQQNLFISVCFLVAAIPLFVALVLPLLWHALDNTSNQNANNTPG